MDSKPEARMAFLLLYWTGMRIGELLALTYEDIDLEKRCITINKSYQRLNGTHICIPKNANDSARQVYRYIRLTYLMNDLLNAVDRDVIGLQVGVELSYLTVPEQEMVEKVHESTGKYPSLEQAKK